MKSSKVAVVTGANRGLGLGTAEELAKQGYVVFMVGRDAGKLDKTAQPLRDKGLAVRTFEADVTKGETFDRLAETIQKEFGKLDVLVNNAGVFLDSQPGAFDSKTGSIFNVPLETIRETFEINTLGALSLVRALAPLLRESAAGRVVNVSSGMGQLSDMNGAFPAYRISKTALNAVTRILSQEFGDTPVKVNSVCPGWVRTDMGGKNANRSLSEGISGIVWAATLPAEGPTGGFFRDGKPIDW